MSERGDGLGAAHQIDLLDLAERAGGQHHRVADPVWAGRRRDGDLAHSGHARRDAAHDDGRGVGGPAAGHVDAGAPDGQSRTSTVCPAAAPPAPTRAARRRPRADVVDRQLETLRTAGRARERGRQLGLGDPVSVARIGLSNRRVSSTTAPSPRSRTAAKIDRTSVSSRWRRCQRRRRAAIATSSAGDASGDRGA